MPLISKNNKTWEELQEENPELVWKKPEYQSCLTCRHIKHWHRGKLGNKSKALCSVRVGSVDLKGRHPVGVYCDCPGFVAGDSYILPIKDLLI